MAAPIHCDYAGCPELADTLVSAIATGDVSAWCGPHFVTMCQAVAASVVDQEADAAAAEAEARLADVEAPPEFPTSPESSDAGDPPAGEPGSGPDGPDQAKPATGTRTRRNGRPGPSTEPQEAAAAPVDPA